MPRKMTLGEQMKQYEECCNYRIMHKVPLIIRIDGRAFHSWTKHTGCERPFDTELMRLMADTAKFLCENIDGCVFSYTQSDEISLLLRAERQFGNEAWFDKRIQKITSITASMATYFFTVNNPFQRKLPAFFDARVFPIPEEDIRAYFIWRQNDASKNSLSMLAQSLYSHNELVGMRRENLMDLCWKKGVNWNDLPTPQKRGYAVYRQPVPGKNGSTVRMKFVIDNDVPIFSAEDCTLFEKL